MPYLWPFVVTAHVLTTLLRGLMVLLYGLWMFLKGVAYTVLALLRVARFVLVVTPALLLIFGGWYIYTTGERWIGRAEAALQNVTGPSRTPDANGNLFGSTLAPWQHLAQGGVPLPAQGLISSASLAEVLPAGLPLTRWNGLVVPDLSALSGVPLGSGDVGDQVFGVTRTLNRNLTDLNDLLTRPPR